MQHQLKLSVIRKIAIMMIAILIVSFFSACAKRVNFQTSSVVPAARGNVKVSRDNNQNYNIQLQVSNLAEVDRLETSRETYVVWMVTDNNETKNIGLLNSSSGMFSSKLKASFETTSSTKPTKIFITAEDDGAIQYPSNKVILSTDSF
jgi:hypothetical protein